MQSYGTGFPAVIGQAIPIRTMPVEYREFTPKQVGLKWENHQTPESSEAKFQQALLEKQAKDKKRKRKEPTGKTLTVMSELQRLDLLEAYESGEYKLRELEKMFNTTVHTINKVTEEAGVRRYRTKIVGPESKPCVVCNVTMTKREGDTARHWNDRQTCSKECRAKKISMSQTLRHRK